MSAPRSIGVREYARRRRELMRMAGADAAILLAAAPPRLRNGDTAWPYRQDSDFLYLSGFDEPAAVLALLPGRQAGQSVLFCREREPAQERWDGAWRGPEGAVRELGLDDAFPIADIDDILPGMLEGRARLYCHFGREAAFDAQLLAWLRRLRAMPGAVQAPQEMLALGHLLHELRLFKSPAELGLLRHAANLGMEAHRVAWAALVPGATEFAIEADFVHALRHAGAQPSYPPIVAGGRNACVLHYARNDAPLRAGELLLLDGGAEWQGYASDITRTLPVNGHFSAPQRALYQLVLDAQRAALARIRPGQSWEAFHQAAREGSSPACARWACSRARLRRRWPAASTGDIFRTRPGIGWGWMCTTPVITASTASRVCWNPAWCSRSNQGCISRPMSATPRRVIAASASASRMMSWSPRTAPRC